jgi:2-C-methyl-D-erythritol 4-phosphate cytidylyltransferase
MTEEKTVIIVAGGNGKRVGGDTPKQFQLICGMPVLMHTLERFYNFDDNIRILLVLAASQIQTWKDLCLEYFFTIPHEIIPGGEERFHSVQQGLARCSNEGLIGIHDGVRPLVSIETIRRCYEEAEIQGSAVPFIPITESVRICENGQSQPINRQAVRIIQTPQVFRADLIQKAYLQDYQPEFTDDSTVVEKAGIPIHLCEGNADNLKITRAIDLEIAGLLLNNIEQNQ